MTATLVTSNGKLFRMFVALLRNEKSFLKPSEYNAHRDMNETSFLCYNFELKLRYTPPFFK